MSIRMINPVARTHIEAFHRPVRIEELHGRRLGFLFNGHVSAVKFWKQLEDLSAELYHPRSVTSLRKENTFAPAAAESEIAELKTRTELVLIGVGAWGSCTSGSVWDAIRLEKEGIPTAVIVHDVFAEAARKQAKAGGIPDLRFLIYSQPPPGETEDQARTSARQVAEALQGLAVMQ